MDEDRQVCKYLAGLFCDEKHSRASIPQKSASNLLWFLTR